MKRQEIPDDIDLVFAVGDVHGRADLLQDLLIFAERATRRDGRRAVVVLLGDLVDRGPQTAHVLEIASDLPRRMPGSLSLLGNHDDWMLRYLEGGESGRGGWLFEEAAETLRSYGLKNPAEPALRDLIDAHFPHHRRLLAEAPHLVTWRGFLFVHAGIDPKRSIASQTEHDCLWIRRPFLDHIGRLDRIVVHGHTPQRPPMPHATENRISVDTGAVATGVLTAAVLDAREETIRFVCASGRGRVESVNAVRVDRGLGTVLDR